MNPEDYVPDTRRFLPKVDTRADVLNKFAREAELIVANNTIGDFTWEGLLISFYHEMEKAGK